MTNPHPITPWTRRAGAWFRLAPESEVRQLTQRAAVRCEHCGGAVCVSNGKLLCSTCGRPA